MRAYGLMIMMAMWLLGCAHGQGPTAAPALIEVEPQLTAGCSLLGTISEAADADNLSVLLARHAMLNKVKARAAQLGATHLVWLHQTDTNAAAQAFRCSGPQ